MINIPDEIVLAWMMTALYLEFEKGLYYHDKEYESDNSFGLPAQLMRTMHISSVLTTEASFNPVDYREVQCLIYPYTSR